LAGCRIASDFQGCRGRGVGDGVSGSDGAFFQSLSISAYVVCNTTCNPFNPRPLIYHLTNSRRVRYSLVKVLLTVSPVRPSLLHSVGVHPANHRFFTSLFSTSSESLFSQLLCFNIYLRCPIVFFQHPNSSGLFRLGASVSLWQIHSFQTIARSCRSHFDADPLFSIACSLFFKIPGVGVGIRRFFLEVTQKQGRTAGPSHTKMRRFGMTHFGAVVWRRVKRAAREIRVGSGYAVGEATPLQGLSSGAEAQERGWLCRT
jgi:hypothetical protein